MYFNASKSFRLHDSASWLISLLKEFIVATWRTYNVERKWEETPFFLQFSKLSLLRKLERISIILSKMRDELFVFILNFEKSISLFDRSKVLFNCCRSLFVPHLTAGEERNGLFYLHYFVISHVNGLMCSLPTEDALCHVAVTPASVTGL